MLADLVEWASRAGSGLYLVVFLLVFGESAFFLDFFVPGEVGLVLSAAAARDAGLWLPVVIAAAAVAASAGDSVSYLLGRRFGPDVATRWKLTRRYLAPELDRARDYFDRRGGRAVFAARWVGALRAAVPAVAGSAGMPYPRFLLWSLTAAVLWATAIATAGWFLGEAVADTIDRLGWYVSIAVIAILATWLVLHRRRTRARAKAPSARGQVS
jgi:membrane protein DedA with SNARE-associated domain